MRKHFFGHVHSGLISVSERASFLPMLKHIQSTSIIAYGHGTWPRVLKIQSFHSSVLKQIKFLPGWRGDFWNMTIADSSARVGQQGYARPQMFSPCLTGPNVIELFTDVILWMFGSDKPLHQSVMFASKARAYLSKHSRRWTRLDRDNTLAFYELVQIRSVKSFITLGPGLALVP